MRLSGDGGTYSDEWSDLGELLDLALNGWPAWHADAACKEAPAEVTWFPERNSRSAAAAEEAKAVCERCLVVSECRQWAHAQPGGLPGIWGGQSGRERSLEVRERRPPPACGTAGGYYVHIRAGTPPCQPCRDALSAQRRARRNGGRRTPARRP